MESREATLLERYKRLAPRRVSADFRVPISNYNIHQAAMVGKLRDGCLAAWVCSLSGGPLLGRRESNVGLNAFAGADRKAPSGSFHGCILPVAGTMDMSFEWKWNRSALTKD